MNIVIYTTAIFRCLKPKQHGNEKRDMTRLPLFAAVIFLLFATLTVAEIKSLTISDDSRPMILLEKFGFTQTGHVTLSVSSVSLSSPSILESSEIGFYLVEEELLLQVNLELQANTSFCVLDSNYVHHLFTFRDLSPPPRSHFDQSYPITSPSDYSLFFANCVPETRVSMKLQTEMYNLKPNGSKNYLPDGSTQLPGLFFIFSLCYLTLFGLWVYFWYHNKRRIHILMAALLLMKALNLICAAEVKHYVKTTGRPHGWNIPFYIFQFIGNVLLFMVIVLIGTGWSLLKPKLQGKEKKLLMIVIPFQVLGTIALIVIGETGPYIQNWLLWNHIFSFVDVSCWVAMRWAIVWLMCCLRKTSKKAVKILGSSPFFGRFYDLVFVYLLFTRVGVLTLNAIADYKYQWVSNAAGEIASLTFHVLMFYYMFMRIERNEYSDVEDEEEGEELLQRVPSNKIEFEL